MRWALQTTLINQQHAEETLSAVQALGKAYILADPYPFTEELVEEIEGDAYIPYGSTTLIKIALKRGWKGLAFDPQTFDHRAWTHNRINMLNQDANCGTVKFWMKEARNYSPNFPVFIRPVGDLKLFNGMLTTFGEITRWFESVDSGNASFGPDDFVAVSSPKNISAEWRCFIVDGNVVSVSMYRCEGRMLVRREDNPALLTQFRRMAQEWLPHVNCVMDVAMSHGEFKVIEFNSINASGFYATDIAIILSALSRFYGAISSIS